MISLHHCVYDSDWLERLKVRRTTTKSGLNFESTSDAAISLYQLNDERFSTVTRTFQREIRVERLLRGRSSDGLYQHLQRPQLNLAMTAKRNEVTNVVVTI
jgi:hypothetical protein